MIVVLTTFWDDHSHLVLAWLSKTWNSSSRMLCHHKKDSIVSFCLSGKTGSLLVVLDTLALIPPMLNALRVRACIFFSPELSLNIQGYRT